LNITQEFGTGGHVIRGYSQGSIRINERSYTRSLIVTPNQLRPDWQPQTLTELSQAHLDPIIELKPEVVLLGVGARLRFPGSGVMGYFRGRGIGMEVMTTAAACRTYNLLMSEGRAVAAALLIRDP
jgi:uncharacterized protein